MAEPKVRFKRDDGSEFPEWEDIRISDMLTICHGKDYKHLGEGNIPVMGTGGVITYVDEALCDWECVCIGRKGTIDRPYYMNKPFWSVDTLFYTKPKDGFLPKYQFYVFQNIDWKFYNEATGVPSLSASTIEKIRVSVASLEEQQRIANFLSSIDEVITASEEEIANLETQKKAVMKKIFSQEVRFKRADGSDFHEWEEKAFEDIFDVITDYVAAGSFADISKNVQYLDKPDYAQLVRTVDVKNSFRNKGFVYVDKRAFDYLYRVELDKEPHIILPNIGANIGEYYLVEPRDLPYERNVLGPNAIMLGTTNNIYFWAQYLGSENFQKNLALIVSSTGQPKFNKTDLRKVAMMSPCEEEQCLIADFLSNFDEAIAAAKKELELWKELKKGLLQQMFVRTKEY